MPTPMTDANGNPILAIAAFDMRSLPDADCVLINFRYSLQQDRDPQGADTSPTYALTVLQAAQVAGALHAEILALKGSNATPIRGH